MTDITANFLPSTAGYQSYSKVERGTFNKKRIFQNHMWLVPSNANLGFGKESLSHSSHLQDFSAACLTTMYKYKSQTNLCARVVLVCYKSFPNCWSQHKQTVKYLSISRLTILKLLVWVCWSLGQISRQASILLAMILLGLGSLWPHSQM